MRTRLLVVGIAALTVGATVPAYGIIATNTIDRHATYAQQGAQVRVSGPIACTSGEWIALRATVRQTATHARASGRWDHRCTGEVQRWWVRARAHGGKPFEWQVRARAGGGSTFARGRARVCALARTRAGQLVTDRRSWCVRVSLSPRS